MPRKPRPVSRAVRVVPASGTGKAANVTSLTIHMGTPPPEGYYIAPGGSDSGAGTAGDPWQTLGKFYSVAVAGDTLYCRGGDYSVSGTTRAISVATVGSPITVQAYPGETPVFTSSNESMVLAFDQGAAYHVVDGLGFTAPLPGIQAGKGSVVWVGNGMSVAGATRTGPVTFRNCTITKTPSGASTAHGIYLSWMAMDVLIEDCTIVGDYAETGNNEQAGIHVYHEPGATGTIARRNIIRNWANGTLFVNPASDGQFLHNTFRGSRWHVKADDHGTLLVRDNAGDVAGAGNIYDGVGGITQDHNFWSQTFQAGTDLLAAGQTGRSAASDGLDTGALDW